MISSFSKSFRAIALNDAFSKSILASVQSWVLFWFTFQCFGWLCILSNKKKRLSIQTRFKSVEVEEKLGLPAKPKKPIAPYYRFTNENRPSVVAKHPKLKPFEINAILGKMWQSLDAADREKFTNGYKTDLIDYYTNETRTKYSSSPSNDDKLKIKEMKVEIKKRRILVAAQRKLRKLGKPKKPLSSFFRYLAAQKDRQLNEPYRDYLKRVTTRWNTLSETEKEKYKTSAEEAAMYK